MTDMEYKTDLQYLYNALQKHLSLFMEQHKKACFEQLYTGQKCREHDCASFMDTAAK